MQNLSQNWKTFWYKYIENYSFTAENYEVAFYQILEEVSWPL